MLVNPALTNKVRTWRFLRENTYEYKSLREVRGEEDGVRVWRVWFQRGSS
jgi:hypothetical protein